MLNNAANRGSFSSGKQCERKLKLIHIKTVNSYHSEYIKIEKKTNKINKYDVSRSVEVKNVEKG